MKVSQGKHSKQVQGCYADLSPPFSRDKSVKDLVSSWYKEGDFLLK